MKRRSFLKSFGVLPFVPSILRGWTPAEATEPEEPTTRVWLDDPMLAAAFGEPLAITVIVPPGRRIKLTGIMRVLSAQSIASSPCVMLQEGDTKLALSQAMWTNEGAMDLPTEAIIEPTPGWHTYKLVASNGVVHEPLLSMIKAERLAVAPT